MKTRLAILLLSLYVIAGGQTNQIVLSLITESRMYFERKRNDLAYSKVSEAIALDRKNVAAYYLRAEISYTMQNYETALNDYIMVLELEPGHLEALSGKILSMFFLGQSKQALSLAEAALKKHPNDPNFYFCRGVINNGRERYSRAIEDFDRALSLGDPKEYRIFLYRGVAKLNLQEYDGAMRDLNQAIELDPRNPSAFHSRGRVHYEQREYQEAINDFNISLNYNPKNEVALYNLGMTYLRLERSEEACKFFHESCGMGYIHACKMVVVECGK